MNSSKDLTIQVDDTFLNIRVVVLLNSDKGYIFEKSKHGYLFAVGGRVKLNESTLEACKREIYEELKLRNIEVEMVGVVENFFVLNNSKKFHEINLVYKANLEYPIDLELIKSDNGHLGYTYVISEDFDKHDIRPKALVEVINSTKPFIHVVNTGQ